MVAFLAMISSPGPGNFKLSIFSLGRDSTSKYHHAIDVAMDAWHSWSNTPLGERTAIFRRAAELLAGMLNMLLLIA